MDYRFIKKINVVWLLSFVAMVLFDMYAVDLKAQAPVPIPAGQPINFEFRLNPGSRFASLLQLVNAVSGYLLQIAIPLAVIFIIYAGIRFLLARGNSSEVQKAKTILWYVIIGLAIVLIGRGFISLVTSLLGVTTISGG